MNRRYCLFLLLTVPILAAAEKGKASWRGPDRPVYVVTHNRYAEGFGAGVQTPRFGDLIAIEIYSPEPHPANEGAVYKVGERLPLFMKGQQQGNVRIEKVMQFQCDSSAALVSAEPPFHLPKKSMALATRAESVRPHANRQRQADAKDRQYAQELAIESFRRHGVPEQLAKDIKINQLIVTGIDNSDSEFLVGSLYVEDKRALYQVFLIGKIGASGATAELTRYHKSTDLTDGTDSEDVSFADQLDLDGDGTDEIVVEVWGYESEEFGIYKRQNGFWRQVYVGGEGGC